MSDEHWETVRRSHRYTEGASDPKSASTAPDAEARAADAGVRQSTELVIGWRVWRLPALASAHRRAPTSASLVLLSTFMVDSWHPGQPMTACCGTKTLRHGIHAFATEAQAVEYMGECRQSLRYVFGEVFLWGRVIVHERGYRAECAYPKRILVPNQYRGSRDIVNELRRSYGVESDWTT